jgi:pyruvate dehydrogenase E2 component (dihydrolipoamide acetyltransferase)
VASEFKLPELGENIETGDVVRVAVAPGESVKEGQPVLELETDKAVIEVPSSVTGTVKDVRVKQGQKLHVGEVVFTFESANGAPAPEAPAQKSEPVPVQHEEHALSHEDVSPALLEKEPAKSPAPTPAQPKTPTRGGAAEFRVPELGENIETGDVVRIAVQPGDTISEGQAVVELETDKAVIEVPSTVSGKVMEIKVKQGQKVRVGDVVLTLEGAGARATTPSAPAQPPALTPQHDASSTSMAREIYHAARTVEGREEHHAFPADTRPEPAHEPMPPQLVKDAGHEHRGPVPASPSVRRLAREIGIDIYDVQGSGPGGRISESDVKAYAKKLISSAPGAGQAVVAGRVEPDLPDFGKWGPIEKVSLRAVRRKTAEHLAEAWNVIPHVTQHDKADVTELEELRKRFAPKAEMAGGKMTMTAIALKVVASALKTFPQFNASIDMKRDEIVYKRYVNVGVAVDTDRGLLVPVIRDVDKKNIIELAAELAALSKKARDKKLAPSDMEGGTFTITNLGGIGGTSFTPIVNHPEVAILGMSRGRMEPVWTGKAFEPRLMLPLSLSYDHRIIDGADAARFVRWIVEALEQPFLLSVQG